jgi:superfamily II DNA or RNA helicase
MAKTLRWYQALAVERLLSHIDVHADTPVPRNPIAAIPTAGGKSLIAVELARAILMRDSAARILVLCPSKELVNQNYDEARAYLEAPLKLQTGIYCAGLNRKDRAARGTFGTAASIVRSAEALCGKHNERPITHIIVDECHLVNVDNPKLTYARIFAVFGAKWVIGLTATPFRQQRARYLPMTELERPAFHDIVVDLTSPKYFNRMMREGYLSQLVKPDRLPIQIDLTGIKTVMGDFDEVGLSKSALLTTKPCVDDALELAQARKHLMWFCVSIEHAEAVHAYLVERGESSSIVHGELDTEERDKSVAEFKAKDARHIVSVGTLTTGFNAPHVDCVVILRPTKSPILHRQIIGRGLRIEEGKQDCLIIDCGGNLARLGAVNAPMFDREDSREALWECGTSSKSVDAKENEAKIRAREGDRKRSLFSLPNIQGETVATLDLYELDILTFEDDLPNPHGQEPCGFYNLQNRHFCENCGRPRHLRLSVREEKSKTRKNDFDEEKLLKAKLLVDDAPTCYHTKHDVIDLVVRVHEGRVLWELSYMYQDNIATKQIITDFDVNSVTPQNYAAAAQLWRKATGTNSAPRRNFGAITRMDTIQKPISLEIFHNENGEAKYISKITWAPDKESSRQRIFKFEPAK